MKPKSFLFYVCLASFALTIASCKPQPKQVQEEAQPAGDTAKAELVWKDYGGKPAVLDIEAYTLENNDFRRAIWTAGKMQVTLMSIPVGGDVGLEQHMETDQFLRIEEGEGRVMMGSYKEALDFIQPVKKDFAVFVPAGKWHNIVNTGDKPLKLYSIYTPVEHPVGTVHATQEEAMAAEHHH